MSRLRAPKRNYLQAQSIAQLKLGSNPPSPSPPSPSPPSPSPPTPHPSLPHPLPLTPLPLTLLAWLKMTVSLRFKKGSVTKFLLVSMIQSAMIVIFQCLSLSLYISGRKPDNLLPRIPHSFDYFKSRVVGKLLRQIHNNNNQLVLFKFSFLYWP